MEKLKTFSFPFPVNLQYFNEGTGDGGQSGDNGQGNQEDQSNSGGDKGNADGGGGNAGNNQPFAVFPDEASFMARVTREGKKQFKEMLKGLGIENEESLKSIIEAHKEAQEKAKTDLQKAQEAKEAAEKQAKEALDKANQILIQTEAKLQAVALGVKPERVDYLLKLADLSEIEIKNGVVDKEAVKLAVEKVLNEVPELKQTAASSKGGSDFSQSDKKDLLTLEAIKNMSVEEAEKRMDEIMAFLEKNHKK